MVKCSTLGWILLAVLVTDAWSAGNDWQLASRFELGPRSSLIVLVEQHGVDLALQVRSGRGRVFEQEGPDAAFGTEVVFLENANAVPARYELFVRPVFNGVHARYDIVQIATPGRAERAAGRALSQVGQKWLKGASARAVLPLAKNALRASPATLRDIATNACLDILLRSGRSAEAIELLQEAPAVADDGAAIAQRAYREYQRANALWSALEVDSALRVIEALADEIATSRAWASVHPQVRRRLEIDIATTLGAVQIFAGRARADRKLIQQGGDGLAALLESLADDSDYALRAKVTEYLAGYYNFIFDRSSNITSALYRQAAQLYERAGDRLSLAAIRNNEAYAELGRGHIEDALRLYLETLQLQRTSRHLEGQAHVRARLGYLYYTIGDYRRGEVRFREAMELYEELGLDLKLVHNKLQLAELLHADDRSGEALALLEDVRSRHGAQLSIEDRLRLATQLALIRLDLGDVRAAERALATLGPLERFDARHWSSLQVAIRLFYLLDLEIARARIDLARRSFASAGARVADALDWLGEGTREPLQQLQLLQLQLTILDRQGDEHGFAQVGERALALVESVRESIDFHTQGPAWSARTSAINGLLVSHYLTRYETSGRHEDFERAFALLQSIRARNLREARAVGRTGKDDADHLQATRELRAANQALIRALLLERTSEPLERRLAKIEEQYQLENALDRPADLDLPSIDGDSIRRQIDPNTQVRILVAGASRSHMIVLTRDGVRVVGLPGGRELETLIEASIRELGSRDRGLPRSGELARLLFADLGSRALPTRIIIEADGVFAGIPFSILLNLQAAGQVPPALILAPSLSELFVAGKSARRTSFDEARKDLVIFADPAFALTTDLGSESSSAWRTGLARLPYTRVEAQAISVYFGDDAVLTFDDANATIANVLAEPARTARVLHIAAHGFGSASDPFLVGLGLANDPQSAGSGLLTTQHIGAVRYHNELVVVSACESGQGPRLEGEGLMSVARSFLASGAKATLSTLWPVPDRANAHFMKEFYFALTQLRADPATALVHAQRKLEQTAPFSHPYYWGGFVLHVADGTYRPVGIAGATAQPRSEARR